ncbi:hypothetical protein FLONG3_6986 [Fusarium longipes]|uniref:Polyketide cyclase dehydrase and lipid transport n=1 Tax=Fusarium longipes TaxID=694270 RepID=A0A395SHW9_9HYPO|nr:hypothetical protein FLONG3_6986 [Fusarium longipes]
MTTSTVIESTTPATMPSPETSCVVFTAGSSITINVPAAFVFDIVRTCNRSDDWDSWIPDITFNTNDAAHTGSYGLVRVKGEAEIQEENVPVEISDLQRCEHACIIAWKGKLLPSWAETFEEIIIVTPKGEDSCEVRTWESMDAEKFGTEVSTKIVEGIDRWLNGLASYVTWQFQE